MTSNAFINRLRATGKAHASGSRDIADTRLRLPRIVIRELKAIAESEGVSMNALVAAFIDAGLRDRGRGGLDDLAPSFVAYLKRTRIPEQNREETTDREEPEFT